MVDYYDKILEFEDYLQNKDVFLNGITNKPCHSDSYMTVMDYTNMDIAIKESTFSKEDMKEIAERFIVEENSVMIKLAGPYLKRKLS